MPPPTPTRGMPQTGRHRGWTNVSKCRSQRAARALAHLPEVDPALAVLAIWCRTADVDADATATSGDVICIGRAFEQMPLQEQIGVLGHHILHIALRHEVRLLDLQARFSDRFSAATYTLCADAIINECLVRGGHALPRPAVLLGDLVARVLPEEETTPHDLLSVWDLERLYLRLARSDASGEALQASYAKETAFQPDIDPDLPDPEQQQTQAEWHAHLLRARQAGGSSGRGIGTALRHLSGITRSHTPWEHHLRRLLARAVTPDPRQSYRRPRSAWIARDAEAVTSGTPRPAFEPADTRQSVRPRLVIGIDTSGSVTPDVLAIFAGEVIGITRKTGAETHILCFDEEVYAHQTLTDTDPHGLFQSLRFRRDGGTSFIDLMAQASRLQPSAIVVLTDTLGTFGPAPDTRVIWASPQPVHQPPPFGEVLDLSR